FSHDHGLTLLNPRAARSRIHFEEVLHKLEEGEVPSQSLLFALPIELTPVENRTLAEIHSQLPRLGINLEEFGGHSWRIASWPAILSPDEAEDFLRTLLKHFGETGSSTLLQKEGQEWVARTMATRAK